MKCTTIQPAPTSGYEGHHHPYFTTHHHHHHTSLPPWQQRSSSPHRPPQKIQPTFPTVADATGCSRSSVCMSAFVSGPWSVAWLFLLVCQPTWCLIPCFTSVVGSVKLNFSSVCCYVNKSNNRLCLSVNILSCCVNNLMNESVYEGEWGRFEIRRIHSKRESIIRGSSL